jgi:hypothetical protein
LDWETIIKVRITGGLGNQLFKFFHGLKIADNFHKDLIIDISWYKHGYMTSSKVNNRTYELSYFELLNSFPIHYSKNKDLDLFRGKIERKMTPQIQKFLGVMTESNEHLFVSPPKYIDGSFERICDLPRIEVIRKNLIFPKNGSDWLKDKLSGLRSGIDVAVHVRRTDYINLPEIYNVLTTHYYKNAISFFNEKYNDVSFWLFSDDILGAQIYLKDVIRFNHVVEPPKNIPAGEILQLMSVFKGVITANSTFSWWAAYIGCLNGTTKEVILPNKFSNLTGDNPVQNLKMPGWHMLDV